MKHLFESWRGYLNEDYALEEGKAEDIIKKYPELQAAFDLGIEKPQYLGWLGKRMGDVPVADAVKAVQAFDQAKALLKTKKKNTDIYAYKSIQDLEDVLAAVGPSRGEKEREAEGEAIHLGQFGDWKVEVPLTMKAACQLGKGTDWCIARTKAANLFMRYVEQPNTILIILTRKGVDSKEDPTAKLNVGFERGSPAFELAPGVLGGVTVDAANEGLTEERLKEILGQQYQPIMRAMQAQVDKMGGVHPARAEFEKRRAEEDRLRAIKQAKFEKRKAEVEALALDGAKNMDLHQEYTAKFRGTHKWFEIYTKKVVQSDPIPEVVDSILEDWRALPGTVVFALAENPRTDPEILDRLFEKTQRLGRPDAALAVTIAGNPNASPEVLTLLSTVADSLTRSKVAKHKSTPLEVLVALIDDVSYFVVEELAQRGDLPKSIAMRLADHESAKVRRWLAWGTRRHTPEVLIKLASDEDERVRREVAQHLNAPLEALKILVKDPEPRVRALAGEHHNWTMLGRAQLGASDLYKRIFKEELEAALREKKRRNL